MTDPPAITRVVLVGHCGLDAGMLRHAVARALPELELKRADRGQDLDALADASSLLLVNRVLPAGFDAGSGIELIRQLQRRDPANRPAMMLVSNFPESQAEAEAAGGRPGFGKAELRLPETDEKLRRAAGVAATA